MREDGRHLGFPLLRLMDPVAEIKPRSACFHYVDMGRPRVVYLNACLEKSDANCTVTRKDAVHFVGMQDTRVSTSHKTGL